MKTGDIAQYIVTAIMLIVITLQWVTAENLQKKNKTLLEHLVEKETLLAEYRENRTLLKKNLDILEEEICFLKKKNELLLLEKRKLEKER